MSGCLHSQKHLLYLQLADVIEPLSVVFVPEGHALRWTDLCVRLRLPTETPEAELFPGECISNLWPEGGTLCKAKGKIKKETISI